MKEREKLILQSSSIGDSVTGKSHSGRKVNGQEIRSLLTDAVPCAGRCTQGVTVRFEDHNFDTTVQSKLLFPP